MGDQPPAFETLKVPANATTSCTLQLHAAVAEPSGDPDDHDPAGSAVLIAPHLAITAKHTFDDYFRRFGLRPGDPITFRLGVRHYTERSATIMPVEALTACALTDIVFLKLGGLPDPPPFSAWPLPMLDLLPPPVGSKIFAVGYHSARVVRAQTPHPSVHTILESAISRGRVVQVHEHYRDSTMLSFPCFETDARFDGGMSGGPVFNEDGRLCGLIASCLPPLPGTDDPHVSHVTTLWPMVATTIPFGRVGSSAMATVLDLMREGTIVARGIERLEIVDMTEGNISVRLHPPRSAVP
jgi:hypothetical protein